MNLSCPSLTTICVGAARRESLEPTSRGKMRRRIRNVSCLFCVTCVFSPTTALAQLEFSVSPTPVGSGARAAGMADAFVAIADDATAASWNPAGLVQLKDPELSIVGSFNALYERFHSSDVAGLNSSQQSNELDLNFMSVVYPLPVSIGTSNISLSLSYQRKYDFTREFDVALNTSTDLGGTPVTTDSTFDFDQSGGFSAISPSVAVEITETLSIGVSFNFWRSSFISDNGWEKEVRSTAVTTIGAGAPQTTTQITREDYSDFSGENYTIGLHWIASPKLAFGLRYDTSFSGSVDFNGQLIRNDALLASVSEQRRIHFPDTISIGAAYRFNDKMTAALDLSRTDWNDLYVQRANGQRFSLVDGANIDDPAQATDLDPTYTVRLGTEYIFIPETTGTDLNRLWSVRGGVFFDQEPASGRNVAAGRPTGDGKADNFYGIAAGIGLLAFQRFNFDVAYQLRYGNNVNSDFISGVTSFDEDMFQHRILFSTVVYF